MQVTILSDKLAHLSGEQFQHEFRVVHADQTRQMAESLGIILRYVQGLPIDFITQQPIKNLPLPEYTTSIWSFAQLSWPSLNTFAASLKTKGYKESAGKHQFAIPRQILLTERLESDAASPVAAQPGAIRLAIVLIPKSGDSKDQFSSQWEVHAKTFRTLCPYYQRNLCLDLTREKVGSILEQTQFSSANAILRGGYEEVVFPDVNAAQAFLDQYSKQMQDSYTEFCGSESFCIGLDSVIPYSEGDRGFRQIVLGRVVGIALGLGVVP